jgi:hypothetical protein
MNSGAFKVAQIESSMLLSKDAWVFFPKALLNYITMFYNYFVTRFFTGCSVFIRGHAILHTKQISNSGLVGYEYKEE